MSIPIPQYIEKLAIHQKNSKGVVSCDIQCTCGQKVFEVYKNKVIKSPECKQAEKIMTDFIKRCRWRTYHMKKENDMIVMWRNNIFGFIADSVKIPVAVALGDNTEVIKIKCVSCQKEHVIYDSRLHGYDAFANEGENAFLQNTYDFKRKNYKDSNSSMTVSCAFQNKESLKEFEEAVGEKVDRETYSNAFSWISITGVLIESKKKVKIYDEETS